MGLVSSLKLPGKKNCAIMIETFLYGKIYQDGLENNVINIS